MLISAIIYQPISESYRYYEELDKNYFYHQNTKPMQILDEDNHNGEIISEFARAK
jgi:hypothetical protein